LLAGAATAGGALLAFRIARARWRRRAVRATAVTEAVLVVDLVQSTHLATHYGDGVAMRARTLVRDGILTLATSHAPTHSESTGDGCLMTFGSVADAVETAVALLADMGRHAAELAPAPPPRVRAAVTYGEILLDGRGAPHGAVINKAFRLEGLTREAFVQVDGATPGANVPEHDRIFLDEAAAEEARARGFRVDTVGYCALKGFAGLHRVFRVRP
jgi:class 3 adenylate cyclase